MLGRTISVVTIEDGALSDNYLKVKLARPREANRIEDILIGGLTADGLHEAGMLRFSRREACPVDCRRQAIVHLATAGRYGIFRDELYYLACADHLAWGYVDQPLLIALIAWIARHLFGDSLLGLRLLPAIAGAAVVWLAGILAREMGGGRFAQAPGRVVRGMCSRLPGV